MYEKLVELLREAADSIETQVFQLKNIRKHAGDVVDQALCFHNELEQVKRERDELEKGLSFEKELCSFYKDVADRAMEQCKKKIDERDHLKKERDAAVADLNELMSQVGLQHYEACFFCEMNDDDDCIRNSPHEGTCRAKWRGLEGREG